MLYNKYTFQLVLGFLYILGSLNSLFAQQLSAKVIDENNQPLIGATVYFDGTTQGVVTNLNGIFNIEIPEKLTEPTLVMTYLGYESLFEKNVQKLKQVYQLKPKAENLEMVDLYASPFSREDMLKVFKRYFLGTGRPAAQCKILNIEDVIVYYVVKENTLYATSTNPIIVKNDYLGYKVSFDLKAFEIKYFKKSIDELDLRQSFYAGFSFFEDINPKKEGRRQKIYERSLSNFFKSLIKEDLDNTEFEVGYKGFIRKAEYIFGVKPLDNNLFQIFLKSDVIKTFREKYISSKILLKYKNDVSTIQFQKPYLRVDQYGNNIDVQNIMLIGELSESRIAKMLPTNFSVE